MSTRKFRFGISGRGETLAAWKDSAKQAEDLGYSTLIMPDHFIQQLAPMYAFVAAAQATTKLRFGTLVLDNDFRHPAMLAKEAATVDLLTDGRLELGIGTGSLPLDNEQVGLPLDPPGIRVERLEETIRILKAFFTAETVTMKGKHYQIDGLRGYPKPVQQPLPMMMGASRPRMLRLAAREMDIISLGGGPGTPSPAEKRDIIRETAGARYDQIELNQLLLRVQVDGKPELPTTGPFANAPALNGSVDQVCDELLKRREETDVSYFAIFGPAVEAFAPIVARLAGK